MPLPDLHPIELPGPPVVPWTQWMIGICLVLLALAAAVAVLRKQLRRRLPPPPAPNPAKCALEALAAIPDNWPVERRSAAGARILRTYLAVLGLGPGIAHPAKDFSGLRSVGACRTLIALLEEMETLACRPHPVQTDWLAARDLAAKLLQQSREADAPAAAKT